MVSIGAVLLNIHDAKPPPERVTPAVLKLLVPRAGEAPGNEITFLRLANGEGCARLPRADAARGALLLERLGRPLHQLALPIAQRHEILCSAAARVWRPAPGCGLPTGAEKGRWLADFITVTWQELGRPCSERAVGHALACAARRIDAHDDERAVLVHAHARRLAGRVGCSWRSGGQPDLWTRATGRCGLRRPFRLGSGFVGRGPRSTPEIVARQRCQMYR